MLILSLKTDQPKAELGLYSGGKKLAEKQWEAGRQLAETLNDKIGELLNKLSKSYEDIEGIVVYKGPGSFTGLRIGMAVANALAYSLNVPVVAAAGRGWIEQGAKKLAAGQNDKIALPEYGGPAKTTAPKS